MKIKFSLAAATAFAIGFGIVVLLGYFIPSFVGFRQYFLQWAIILAAVALIIGLFNLLSVHVDKITGKRVGQSIYSLVLVLSAGLTFLVVVWFGPNSVGGRWLFQFIQLPIEASLMAVLAVTLAYASVRLLRRRPNGFSMIFFATVVLVLLGTGSFITWQYPNAGMAFENIRALIARYPATAGARGILLGVALGTIATGLRVLMGIDRPYGG